MSVEGFIETNIFIHQLDDADSRKAAIADELIGDGIVAGTRCISFQVVQECLNTVKGSRG